MTMAPDTFIANTRRQNQLCRVNEVHDQIDHIGCQSSLSGLYKCHNRSTPEGSSGTSYDESCIDQKQLAIEHEALCNPKLTKADLVSEIATANATRFCSDAVNTDGSRACLGEQSQQHMRQQRSSTLQELYMGEHYDDEDDDDSDWEPGNRLVNKEWFCANCTLPNLDDVCCCEGCGEIKGSKISQNYGLAQISINSESVHKHEDSSLKRCTSIGFDERMLLHSEVELKSHPHPERPDRLRAIAAKLVTAGLISGKCSLIPAREITQEELLMAHSMDHIKAVQETQLRFSSYFTPDTYANVHSARAARIAAGLCTDLARSIMSGCTRNGFALVRPPGHHAGIKQAMGFCLHNNAAIAALAAQRAGAKKVLIVDWDVHHGNGTQEIFEENKSVLYVSLHRHEEGSYYPGTGAADEVGIMDGKGYSVNIPWSCGGVGDNDYIFAFQHIVIPIAVDFEPDIIIISAGFDAARGDPLGGCDVTPVGYAQMTHMLNAVSDGKLLVVLEGGYNLRAISSSAMEVVKVLLGEVPKFEMSSVMPSAACLKTISQVMRIQLKFWPILLKPSYLFLLAEAKQFKENRREQLKKRKRLIGPLWWKWGSKRFVYELLYPRLGGGQRRTKRVR